MNTGILWLLSGANFQLSSIMEEEQKRAEGYISSSDLQYLLGKKGVTVTDLRPVGVGQFDGVNFDVMSGEGYISKDCPVEIIKVEGSKIMVKELGRQ